MTHGLFLTTVCRLYNNSFVKEGSKIVFSFRVFLVKYLCRCHGIDIYQEACRSKVPLLQWVAIDKQSNEQVRIS